MTERGLAAPRNPRARITASRPSVTRRQVLSAGAGLFLGGLAGFPAPVKAGARGRRVIAEATRARLVGPSYPETAVWAYDGEVPGPPLRARQGDRLRVVFDNRLPEPSTIHWHGLRIANAMDGVPGLTQEPVPPGGAFTYEFDLPDAGTFWYHPHFNSTAQAERGLAAALIVEEKVPPKVDRDILWVLDDWRLDENAALVEDFDNLHDLSHAGRIGNTVTVNGVIPETEPVTAGERIRLRLINVANARFFALRFAGHRPVVIALDGQPCGPHEAPDGRIVLGPAMRADLIIDLTGEPGSRHQVIDDYYPRFAYRLLDLAYGDGTILREAPLGPPAALPANPLPEPDIGAASRHRIVLEGGAMGGMARAMLNGRSLDLRELARAGKVWALNGVVADGMKMEPLVTLKRGESTVIELANDSAFEHPMHLHGLSFRVLARDGLRVSHDIWQDTVVVAPRERVEIAFVADNPGDWLFHCHVLEHMAAGMAGIVRIA